jgi:hypothetical protein
MRPIPQPGHLATPAEVAVRFVTAETYTDGTGCTIHAEPGDVAMLRPSTALALKFSGAAELIGPAKIGDL